jgi:D-lactate dehydrogenase
MSSRTKRGIGFSLRGKEPKRVELLRPDVRRIGRPDGPPHDDRIDDAYASGTPEPLRSKLIELLGPDRVAVRVSDLVRYASDASPYRYLPQAVVLPSGLDDMVRLLRFSRESGVPLVFRAGGTSLNGQSQTDGILVDVRRHWGGLVVEEDGKLARVRPGMVLGDVNKVLARYGRRLGPDPASKNTATVGGVVANNAGGMRSGIRYDSYSMVRSMTLVLSSGTVIDTSEVDAERRFAEAEPELAQGLFDLREELLADDELVAKVRRKFRIRNTTGYRLCALLDAETPLEMFRRLVVGSEGTLAFIAEAVIETVALPEHTTVSWLYFPSIDAAARVVPDLVALGATAVEMMLAPALAAASQLMAGTPSHWRDLPEESAALLVEFGGDSASLDRAETATEQLLAQHDVLGPPDFSRDDEVIELAWGVREGMFGLLGKLRPEGTALIGEDVCCAPERIADFARDIGALLGVHGFNKGVSGHAAFGNLHFLLTPELGNASERARYDAFMRDLVRLVVDDYDGSLKAEHGTGINMAPFVEHEWGPKATSFMWRIKQLADPSGILGPGVLLNRDPGAHLANLKSTPVIEAVANTCVECGFCEPVCPSRNVTTTPRQRIVLRREMARQPEGSRLLEVLRQEYEYDAIETCAADGSCGPACPVGIDTGRMMKQFRAREASERARKVALQVAKRWGAVETSARRGLTAANAISRVMGDAPLSAAARATRSMFSTELVPDWSERMPQAAPRDLPQTSSEGAAAVYFPACINRIFGRPAEDTTRLTTPEALVRLSERAGMPVVIPDDVVGHCCATPWSSKGYVEGNKHMAEKVAEAMWRWSEGGRLPVVVDASSCTYGLRQDVIGYLSENARERYLQITLLDSVAWLNDTLLPRLSITQKLGSVALHPTCSGRHLGLAATLQAALRAAADEVVVPLGASCCGMAGDRGLLHPELVQSALRDESANLLTRDYDAYVSSNRTCELALHQVTGRSYVSAVVLFEELTKL